MDSREKLITVLADGRFHSGQELGAALGVSRAMVWKLVVAAREGLGLEIHGVAGKGYRLSAPLDLLEPTRILEHVDGAARARMADIQVSASVDSTNRSLLEAARRGAPTGSVVAAEHQSGGRGRRGRRWVSPFGQNLYLSLLWRYQRLQAPVSALSIAAGVAVVRALWSLGFQGLGLKWPNDVLADGRKLAGILLEMGGEPTGPCHVVVGVGLNVNMDLRDGAGIDQPWTSLRLLHGRPVSRNEATAAVLAELTAVMAGFGDEGLTPVLEDWRGLDLTWNAPLQIHAGTEVVPGTGRGIDVTGALRVATPGGTRVFHSGEVSVRIAR